MLLIHSVLFAWYQMLNIETPQDSVRSVASWCWNCNLNAWLFFFNSDISGSMVPPTTACIGAFFQQLFLVFNRDWRCWGWVRKERQPWTGTTESSASGSWAASQPGTREEAAGIPVWTESFSPDWFPSYHQPAKHSKICVHACVHYKSNT